MEHKVLPPFSRRTIERVLELGAFESLAVTIDLPAHSFIHGEQLLEIGPHTTKIISII